MPPETRDLAEHVHPSLRRRIRIFLIIGGVMLLLVLWDIATGALTIPIALIGIVIGAIIGFFSSRIFHLSWDKDGEKVVGRIDTIGWIVLALYIVFEIIRSTLFATIFASASSPTAVTFAFIAAALIARVFGLRGRILKILEEEQIFPRLPRKNP